MRLGLCSGKRFIWGGKGCPQLKRHMGKKNPMDLYCSRFELSYSYVSIRYSAAPAYPLLPDPSPPSLPYSRPESNAVNTLYIAFEMVKVPEL